MFENSQTLTVQTSQKQILVFLLISAFK